MLDTIYYVETRLRRLNTKNIAQKYEIVKMLDLLLTLQHVENSKLITYTLLSHIATTVP